MDRKEFEGQHQIEGIRSDAYSLFTRNSLHDLRRITMRNGIVLMLLLFAGCDSKIDYVELKMPKKNPTSYIFDAPLDTVKQVIRDHHREFPLRYMEPDDDSSIIWGKAILRLPENKNDFFIMNLLPIDTSLIYIGVKKHINYFYSLHLHLKVIDSTKTLVEINTIEPDISIGVRFPYNVLKFSEPDAALLKRVSPSTIEEYKVLLVIGAALGVKDSMPPLILPEPAPRQ